MRRHRGRAARFNGNGGGGGSGTASPAGGRKAGGGFRDLEKFYESEEESEEEEERYVSASRPSLALPSGRWTDSSCLPSTAARRKIHPTRKRTMRRTHR